MAFFGLTRYGVSDYFKFVMRPDYKEPQEPADILKLAKEGIIMDITLGIIKIINNAVGKLKRSFSESIKEMDVYSGLMDGYSYRSNARLHKQRDRAFIKPDGINLFSL